MNILRQRLVLLVPVLLTCTAAACSNAGIGSGPPLPPPVGNFSNASLKGQYAFSMSGREICNGSGSFFARAGSFTADGNGNITGGAEDVNVCAGVGTLIFTASNYSISADGRGTLSLTNSTGTTHYSITLSTTAGGFIIQADTNASASGSLRLQNAAAFSDTAIAGGYVFDVGGLDVTNNIVNPASVIGRFTASGAGGITQGLYDSNIGGTLSGQQAFPPGALYDLSGASATAYGRGTANIAGLNFAFYVVDATHLKLIGTDFPSGYAGDAYAQQNIAYNISSLNGGFAFLIGGSTALGPVATAGRFTADGAGNIVGVVIDENNNGGVSQLPTGTISSSYTVDGNQMGGGTLTWTDSFVGTFQFIFYLISPGKAVFQETDSGITSDGILSAQTTTPITAATTAGNYAFNWSGVLLNRDEVDFVGQLNLVSAAPSTFTGALDYNDFGASTIFPNVATNGTLAINGDGTTFNTFTANLLTNPAATLTFTAYVIDANTIYVVGDTGKTSQGDPVIAGTLLRQP